MRNSYRDLIVWQKSVDFVLAIYEATKKFPREELYGLTSQMRRAAVSIPSNIAEGQGRSFAREFDHFLSNALASLAEIETQVTISAKLKLISEGDEQRLLGQAGEIGRMLNGSIASKKKSAHAHA